MASNKTIMANLSACKLPGGERTWLDLTQEIATAEGAQVKLVCSSCRLPRVVHVRHLSWAAVRALGYSLHEIAEPWGVNHTTVCDALQKLVGLGLFAPITAQKKRENLKKVRVHLWLRAGAARYELVDPLRPALRNRSSGTVIVGDVIDGWRYSGITKVPRKLMQEPAREAA